MNARTRLQVIVTVAALAIVSVHHFWPAFHADAFTATFLLVAVLPWLGPLLKSIKLPGGLEVELRELREEIDQTKGAVASATIRAQVGAATVSGSRGQSSLVEEHGTRASLLALGTEYERVRDSSPEGWARTESMSQVLARMFREADSIRELDIVPLLASTSRGERLAGIAYAHQHPSAEEARPLVTALSKGEDTPFGQYWILRVLRRIAEVSPSAFGEDLRRILRTYRDSLTSGTDRHYEVTQLLRDIASQPAAGRDSWRAP